MLRPHLLRARRAVARHRRRRRPARRRRARLRERPGGHDRVRHVDRLRAAARVDRRASTASTRSRSSSRTARCRPTRSSSTRSSSPGDAVVVERPTYDRTLLGLRQRGAEIVPVDLRARRDRRRRRSAQLLEGGLRPKLAHIIPNFQNPAGYTLSREKRDRLLELAARVRLPRSSRTTRTSSCASAASDAADDALARRVRPRRLRVVVLQDGLPRHPRRLPRRPAGR